MFAGGIILATGFIHMLSDGQKSLEQVININYPFFALISSISMIILIGIELIIKICINTNINNQSLPTFINDDLESTIHINCDQHINCNQKNINILTSLNTQGSVSSRISSFSVPNPNNPNNPNNSNNPNNCIDIFILEFGIAIHSIIIGINLGIINDHLTLIQLLIAISFHQFFEGFVVGQMLVNSDIVNIFHKIIIIGVFCSTTPIGIIIGICINQSISDDSYSYLLSQGILDSISAGILIYAALVNFIAKDFIFPNTYVCINNTNFTKQIKLLIIFTLGYTLMALLGIWS